MDLVKKEIYGPSAPLISPCAASTEIVRSYLLFVSPASSVKFLYLTQYDLSVPLILSAFSFPAIGEPRRFFSASPAISLLAHVAASPLLESELEQSKS